MSTLIRTPHVINEDIVVYIRREYNILISTKLISIDVQSIKESNKQQYQRDYRYDRTSPK